MRLAVCILHYGDPALAARLHAQFVRADPETAGDVLVLDNAAPQPYPDPWRRLRHNVYWAGALAWSLDALDAEGYTHVWFCNNDVELVSAPPYMSRAAARWGWLERRGRVGMVSPAATSNPYHGQMVHVPGAECRRAPYVDGIAPIISLECARALGGLDCRDNPYGYGVDVWLSLRASRSGWGVWVDHGLVMRHRYHTTANGEPGFMPRAAAAEHIYMSARLGPDWKRTLAALQHDFKGEAS